jgi:hypothetical protein
MDDSLDAVIKMRLRDLRGLSEESGRKLLLSLERLVTAKSDPKHKKHADRLALLKQAEADFSRRCATTPSAAELAEWVRQ